MQLALITVGAGDENGRGLHRHDESPGCVLIEALEDRRKVKGQLGPGGAWRGKYLET